MHDKNEKIDKKLWSKVSDFLMWDYRPYFKKNSLESYFDAFSSFETAHILTIILAASFDNQAQGKGFYAEKGLGEFSNRLYKILGPNGVRKRLMLLARYWFISCDNSRIVKMPNGKSHREKCLIYPNAAFQIMFEARQTKTKNNFKRCSVAIGDNREENHQGLGITVKYGYGEYPNFKIEDLNYGGQNTIDYQQKTAENAEKKANNDKWRKYNETFVACAANLWRDARSRLGFGPDVAPWNEETSKLGSAQRDQRKNLTSIFESLGGTVAALSWYVYVLGTPQLDEKGKLAFDPKIPHRQYKGSDMKPKKFANEISAIIADADFKYLSTTGWPQARKLLLKYFSEEILEIGPKDGQAYSVKVGYVFGEKKLPNLPNQNV